MKPGLQLLYSALDLLDLGTEIEHISTNRLRSLLPILLAERKSLPRTRSGGSFLGQEAPEGLICFR